MMNQPANSSSFRKMSFLRAVGVRRQWSVVNAAAHAPRERGQATKKLQRGVEQPFVGLRRFSEPMGTIFGSAPSRVVPENENGAVKSRGGSEAARTLESVTHRLYGGYDS